MIELPFASFFLSKMLGQHTINLDIDHLQSLDTELYKNLLYLKVSEIKIGRSIETDFYHVMFSTAGLTSPAAFSSAFGSTADAIPGLHLS